MSSTKHVGDLGMSSYAHWITFGGARLVHIHWNRLVSEPNEVASTSIGSLIQALICCHPSKIVGKYNPPMVGHSPTNMHIDVYVYATNVAQHESIPKINPT